MAQLVKETPIPIALDEELIGIPSKNRAALIHEINPHYIILKPSLIGGFKDSTEYIKIAESNNTGWWITSALEANIGLNAIAQYASTYDLKMPQGLGTGQVFKNNVSSPLELISDQLWCKIS